VTIRSAGLVLAAVLTLGACGTTYVDTEVTVPDTSPDVTTTTLPSVDPDAPIADLLDEIEALMSDLDERIIDERDHVETMARIDELWTAAERQIRAADPNDVFNFEQAIELARSGVERRRPADASKGYKIMTDVVDAYLGR
jgi:FAD/FMN-containing dehydrogenase